MKILCISDTHSLERKMPDEWMIEADVLIHAGDIENSGIDSQDVFDYCNWLSSHSHKYKKIIQIAGNHDGTCYKNKALTRDLFSEIKNLVYLENESYVYDDIKFYGTPITPTFFNWHFMCDEDKISKYFDMIPKDTDVLITHGPAYGILDKTYYAASNVGSKTLLNKINEVKPDINIFGHIHEGYGTTQINNTTYINASICNLHYKPVNKPIMIEYHKEASTTLVIDNG